MKTIQFLYKHHYLQFILPSSNKIFIICNLLFEKNFYQTSLNSPKTNCYISKKFPLILIKGSARIVNQTSYKVVLYNKQVQILSYSIFTSSLHCLFDLQYNSPMTGLRFQASRSMTTRRDLCVLAENRPWTSEDLTNEVLVRHSRIDSINVWEILLIPEKQYFRYSTATYKFVAD